MEVDWEHWQPGVRANLLFVVQGGQILLIRKKTGFGAGGINGPGGKLEPGETAVEAAVREVREELTIVVHDPEDMGELCFQFVDGLAMHVQVFRSNCYEGEPVETVEAKPLWYDLESIPFDEMWEDDRYWLREMVDGRRFSARFIFEERSMLWKEIDWLDRVESWARAHHGIHHGRGPVG
jgi:8-oxo-dGTP diphosphatase